MKVLISSAFKALRHGAYVSADEAAGEFIFDTTACDDLSVATLLEIATANKIEAKKDKKDNVVKVLEAGLKKLKLAEQSERPISDVVDEIVKAGVAAEKSDDEILIAIVQAGVKFKLAGKLFQQAMTKGGYRVSNKERKTAIRDILVEAEFQPEEYSEVNDMIVKIVKGVKDTTNSQAMQGIKAYAKEFELELPVPEKGAVGGFKAAIQNAVVANPEITLDEFKKLVTEAGKDVERSVKNIWPSIQWAKRVGAAMVEAATGESDK